jgi:ABC-type lipoprotein export system ATPase subunit
MTAAIEMRDVFRIYRTAEGHNAALRGLSLDVQPGEVAAVVGPSGAGKSTLLRILAALDRQSAGSVRVLGVEPEHLTSRAAAEYRARSLGFLDQHYTRALSPDLTARETIGLQLALGGHVQRERDGRANELLERVGLRDRADALPHSLSGGERQRVALCASLAHGPQLLLADEPAGELDAENARLVYALIAELAREREATVLIVSHDRAVASVADRTFHIRDGRLSEERHGADEGLVVDRSGWVRLPEALRRASGIGSHAHARGEGEAIVLTRASVSGTGGLPEEMPEPATAHSHGPVVAELRGVEKRFGDRVVFAGFDASFRAGRVTAVVGRSGSGKTTLLHLLAGLERPSGGDVVVLERSLGPLTRSELAAFRRDGVALVRQEPGLIPFLSARENIELALAIRNHDGSARDALAHVELEHRADQRIDRLSVGERQRVAIARALATAPDLLLLDEPTAHLDEANAQLTARLLGRAARAAGAAVVCATHDPVLIEHADEQIRLDTAADG